MPQENSLFSISSSSETSPTPQQQHRVQLSEVPSSLTTAELERSLSALGLGASVVEDGDATAAEREVTLGYASREQAQAAVARLEAGQLPVEGQQEVRLRARMVEESASSSSPMSSNASPAQRSPRKNFHQGT